MKTKEQIAGKLLKAADRYLKQLEKAAIKAADLEKEAERVGLSLVAKLEILPQESREAMKEQLSTIVAAIKGSKASVEKRKIELENRKKALAGYIPTKGRRKKG